MSQLKVVQTGEPRRQRHRRRKPQSSKIERRSGEEQLGRRHELFQKDDRPPGEQNPDEQPQPAEDQALSRQLPYDAAPAGAQCASEGDLVPPFGRSCERQNSTSIWCIRCGNHKANRDDIGSVADVATSKG
jgi:hypothetical protein